MFNIAAEVKKTKNAPAGTQPPANRVFPKAAPRPRAAFWPVFNTCAILKQKRHSDIIFELS